MIMIVEGRQIAAEILVRTKARVEKGMRRPKVVALVGEETPATKSYLKIKAARATNAGCDFEVLPYPSDYTDADAAIIQLPLPDGVDAQAACDAIPLEKDADVLSRAARAKFEQGEQGALLPPVVAAIKEILKRGGVDVTGKGAVVIGSGFLVGAPAATWLAQQGARVTVATRETDLTQVLKDADIVIAGAGVPGLIKPEMLKEGIVLIDASTSESNGVIVGDADPACAEKCSLFTPVPGGVGPVAVACLFENVLVLSEKNQLQSHM
jgi:methylenetetrahydrofolate dehydrogenase (NADP+) / methenyltetrahydrofolate cyclohydrolase